MPLRNVLLLALAQIVSMSATSGLLLVGGIIGADLAPTPALATMSIALTVVGVAVFTVPAALLAQRFGRRRGFSAAALLAACAMLLAAVAVAAKSFVLFCAATLLVGCQAAFAQQYRFAAMESVPPRYHGRAVSTVLVGGIVAGWLGPALTARARDLIDAAPYAGSFVLQAGLFAASAVLLLLGLRDVRPVATDERAPARPLAELVRQPVFLLAAGAAATAYAVMSFIMTATPLELHDVRGFDLADTAWVIQSHVMAMYIPSLFTGILIERLGLLSVLLTGTFCLLVCAVGALVSEHLVHYWGALVLLGVGWNFQFVAGTVLLGHAARPHERYRVQAVNDFIVFGVQALASLSAGGVLLWAGWRTLNLLTVPLLVLTAIGALVARRATLSR